MLKILKITYYYYLKILYTYTFLIEFTPHNVASQVSMVRSRRISRANHRANTKGHY